MKKRTSLLLLLAAAVLASPVLAAPLVLPPADTYSTSFESTDVPPYSLGNINGQNGWSLKGSTVLSSAQIINGGSGGAPATPDGTQMLALRNAPTSGGAPGGSPKVALQFATTALTDTLHFSGLTAFSGTIGTSTDIISRFYLNDSANEFNGVIFGLRQESGSLRFFYNDGLSATSFGSVNALADTFYRFELDIQITSRTFDIRVYSHDNNTLLGSYEGAAFRGTTSSLSHLRLNNLSTGTTPTGDNFVTYYDQIWINSTAAVPEPSTWALLLGAGALFLLITHRRKLSTNR